MRQMNIQEQFNYLNNERNIAKLKMNLGKYPFCKCSFYRVDVFCELYSVVMTCLNEPFGGQVLKENMTLVECYDFIENNCDGLIESDYSWNNNPY